MKSRLAAALLALIAIGPGPAQAQAQAQAQMQVQVQVQVQAQAQAQAEEASVDAAVQAWAAAFNECSGASLAGLYDPAATLWGTTSQTLITSAPGVRFYFDSACALQPRATVSLGERVTRVFGESAISAGTYTFTRDGKPLPARFSFAFVRRDGRWWIVQHHSSWLAGRG